MAEFTVDGDTLLFQGWPVATFRSDAPPSVRAEVEDAVTALNRVEDATGRTYCVCGGKVED
jgi:hypothetical protein